MIATEPPAQAVIPPLDRRTLFKTGIMGAGLAATPLLAQSAERGFTHGVASGEPSANGVLLWTRYLAMQDVPLTWQVLSADTNRQVVAEGEITASPDRDWCVKAMATGLEAGRWYYYRFIAPDGTYVGCGAHTNLAAGAGGAVPHGSVQLCEYRLWLVQCLCPCRRGGRCRPCISCGRLSVRICAGHLSFVRAASERAAPSHPMRKSSPWPITACVMPATGRIAICSACISFIR